MQRRLTIRAKILWIAFGINALCTLSYTVNSYYQQRQTYLDGVDAKLLAAAQALPLILPRDFHDQVNGPNALAHDRHHQLVKLLTDYCDSIALTYLYSFMEFDGKFRTTSTSDTQARLASGHETPFFDEYKQPPKRMIEAWQTGTVQFDEYTDEFGRFRSIFIPMRTGNGTRFIVGADRSLGFIQAALHATLYRCIMLGALIFLVVWLVSYMVLNRMLEPVSQLTSYARGLSGNEFRFGEKQRGQLAIMVSQYHDEVGQLAAAFSEMERELLHYIRDLKETTAIKERIESELKIAHDIQMSFLHKIFPAFPTRSEFDLYAMLEPAKEVGGDLYDFCLLDDDHLFFYVGDVSDKGVPAALFMAVTMSLMKRTAQQAGIDPAEILSRVNKDLASENDNLLFVTVFCAILNVKTGEMHYSNAGHNPPVLVRAGGNAEWLKLPDGLVLAVMSDTPYRTKSITMAKGDTILLYTDGVTEAMGPAHQLYSDDKLLQMAGALGDGAPIDLVKQLVVSVKEHAAGVPQSDDITVMALKFKGS